MNTHILTAQHGVIGETHTQRTPETSLPASSLIQDGLGGGGWSLTDGPQCPHLFNGIIRSSLLSLKMDVTSVKRCRVRRCGTVSCQLQNSDEGGETSVLHRSWMCQKVGWTLLHRTIERAPVRVAYSLIHFLNFFYSITLGCPGPSRLHGLSSGCGFSCSKGSGAHGLRSCLSRAQ